jgi:hypothetical protein
MSRGPYSFKQRDMTRAVKAVVAAGLAVARVEVDKQGRIIVIPGKAEPTSSSWDQAIADLESR